MYRNRPMAHVGTNRLASAIFSRRYFSASAGFLMVASNSLSRRIISCSWIWICWARSITVICICSSLIFCFVFAAWKSSELLNSRLHKQHSHNAHHTIDVCLSSSSLLLRCCSAVILSQLISNTRSNSCNDTGKEFCVSFCLKTKRLINQF